MKRYESKLLIISGPVGVGKTTTAEELSAILEGEDIGHTFVDLDGLSKLILVQKMIGLASS